MVVLPITVFLRFLIFSFFFVFFPFLFYFFYLFFFSVFFWVDFFDLRFFPFFFTYKQKQKKKKVKKKVKNKIHFLVLWFFFFGFVVFFCGFFLERTEILKMKELKKRIFPSGDLRGSVGWHQLDHWLPLQVREGRSLPLPVTRAVPPEATARVLKHYYKALGQEHLTPAGGTSFHYFFTLIFLFFFCVFVFFFLEDLKLFGDSKKNDEKRRFVEQLKKITHKKSLTKNHKKKNKKVKK